MEKRNNHMYRTLVIVALITAVLGISVAFAALTQTLTIGGTGAIQSNDWRIVWSTASGSKASGGSGVDYGSALGTNTATLTISGIVLEKPGDKIKWIITAFNDGDIDAELESVSGLLSKTITFNESEESELTDSDILVTLTKNDAPTYSGITALDSLNSGASQQYLLTVEFSDAVEVVPTHDVGIEITALFPWIQK